MLTTTTLRLTLVVESQDTDKSAIAAAVYDALAAFRKLPLAVTEHEEEVFVVEADPEPDGQL